MKAVVSERYGSPDVLELREIPRPTPKDDEILIKVYATGVNAFDWHLLRGDPFVARFMGIGLLRPKHQILGADTAGRVEAVGQSVTDFKPGDAVFGDLSAAGIGGFAEYTTASARMVARKPERLSFAEAAAVPMAGVTALQALRDAGRLEPGQRVLIHGSSGGVGTFAVQIAKAMAAEVTAVCSTAKVDLARKLGADHVIDYTKEDFARQGKQYDLILGVNGDRSLSDYEKALTPTGKYVMVGGSTSQIFQAALFGSFRTKKGGRSFRALEARPGRADLETLSTLIESGEVAPVMDRCYPLEQTAEAIRYVEGKHATGKVVIVVRPEETAA